MRGINKTLEIGKNHASYFYLKWIELAKFREE